MAAAERPRAAEAAVAALPDAAAEAQPRVADGSPLAAAEAPDAERPVAAAPDASRVAEPTAVAGWRSAEADGRPEAAAG